MVDPFLPIIIFLVFIIATRYMGKKAYSKLEDSKKVELKQLFYKRQMVSLVITVVVLIAFFLLIGMEKVNATLLYVSFIMFFIIKMGWQTIRSNSILKAHQFPPEFIRNYNYRTLISGIGFIVFFILITK